MSSVTRPAHTNTGSAGGETARLLHQASTPWACTTLHYQEEKKQCSVVENDVMISDVK